MAPHKSSGFLCTSVSLSNGNAMGVPWCTGMPHLRRVLDFVEGQRLSEAWVSTSLDARAISEIVAADPNMTISGLVSGKIYRKPSIFPVNMGRSCKCSLKPNQRDQKISTSGQSRFAPSASRQPHYMQSQGPFLVLSSVDQCPK